MAIARKRGTFGGKGTAEQLPGKTDKKHPAMYDGQLLDRLTIARKELKPEKNQLRIRDAEYETLYVTVINYQGTEGLHPGIHPRPSVVKLMEKALSVEYVVPVVDKKGAPVVNPKTGLQKTEVKKRVSDTHRILFWSDYCLEWLSMIVSGDMIVTTDHSLLPPECKPHRVQQAEAQKSNRAAHLKKFERTRPIPPVTPADGKRVFRGTIGKDGVLLDAGDGSRVATVPEGTPFKKAAKELKRELVGREDATPHAVEAYDQVSIEARERLKKEGLWKKPIRITQPKVVA